MPAGWHNDPNDASQYRYWDGAKWTEHYAPKPPPVPAAPVKPKNGYATASAVIGALSILLFAVFVVCIVGLILGIVGVSVANRLPNHYNRSTAVAGIVMSAIGLAASIGWAATHYI